MGWDGLAGSDLDSFQASFVRSLPCSRDWSRARSRLRWPRAAWPGQDVRQHLGLRSPGQVWSCRYPPPHTAQRVRCPQAALLRGRLRQLSCVPRTLLDPAQPASFPSAPTCSRRDRHLDGQRGRRRLGPVSLSHVLGRAQLGQGCCCLKVSRGVRR